MELADKTKERSTVILAVLTLVVIGLSLLISTYQIFRRQSEAEEQHLFLTTKAVLLSIEHSVRRGPVREGENRLSPRMAEFFQSFEQEGDLLFVGFIDPHGDTLLTAPLHGNTSVTLPPDMIKEMLGSGEWHGRLVLDKRGAYVYGKRLEPLRGMHMSLRDELGPLGFLVVGVDTERYLTAYAGFRRNVIFQALYILAAALCTWALGIKFLSRREQARRTVALELFQAKLLDHLPDGLITLNADGMVQSANPAALSILKQKSRDVLGKPASELPVGIAACAPRDGGQPLKKNGEGRHIDWRQVSLERARLEVLALPLNNDKDNAWMLIIRDRTMLRNLEQNLANAEKLAAVGALAAGVAHEVRNPLSSLRGFAQYFVKKLAGRMPEEEYAKTMVREADRLNRVITDLLFLSRSKPVAPQHVDFATLLREITDLLHFDLERRNIVIENALNAPQIFADEEALKQALLNLLLNSFDALEAKRKINAPPAAHILFPAKNADGDMNKDALITASSNTGVSLPDLPTPDPAASLCIASDIAPGGVWIEVRDNGCGMTQEQQSQAFEPFFTTKKRGTGLGLALVHRLMLDHGGSATIFSETGKGCAVRLFFPNEREQAPGTRPA
ncbi:MAG: PAS domain-containing protein [Desulfovibrio sp.]|jgi:signal transduction histidine kinase|nr:PAS domain-containing protein [Desulfovibrio sp.]